MLIHALDKEQSSRANNGSGARKSALQSSTPRKACQAGRLGLLRGGARAEGRALLQLTLWSWQLAMRLGKTLVPRKQELRVEVRGRGRGVVAVLFFMLKKKTQQTPDNPIELSQLCCCYFLLCTKIEIQVMFLLIVTTFSKHCSA